MRFLVTLAGCLLVATNAFADTDDLSIAVQGFDSWPAAVASLQHDLHAEGRTLEVGVRRADGSPIPCSDYRLALDEIGAHAFQIGQCDANTSLTSVTLAHRSALFSHDDIVATPLAAGISASHLSIGGSAGGASAQAGSDLHCSVSVHPYIDDLETGRRLYLNPGRFQLRVIDSTITVAPTADGWTLMSGGATTLETTYDIVDIERERVVSHDHATLTCANEASTAPAPAHVAVPPGRLILPPPPNPHIRWTADVLMGAVGYLPLSHIAFHVGNGSMTGNALGIDGAMIGSGGTLGFGLEAYHLFVAIEPHVYLSNHVALLGADVAAGAMIGGDRFGVRLGVYGTAWRAWLTNMGGIDASTATQYAVGPYAQFVFRAAPARSLNGRVHFSETSLGATLPVFGNGAFVATWTVSWGGGI